MRNLTVVYATGNADQFEANVPLHFVGQRNAKLGFSNDIDILFLEGYEFLEERYRVSLHELGFNLYNVRKIYSELREKYPLLGRFSDFNQKCFLRWLVIKEFFSGEKIIHYDADVVFNDDPSMFLSKMNGKTFVLQGCPALTCISDISWFSHYEENFNFFANDIERYSKTAWVEREGWELSEQYKWAGQRDKKIIASDQDLISHLIHADRIPQNEPYEVLSGFSNHIFFENPLYIHAYSPWCENLPFNYKRIADIDYINEKRVAFWHMQSDFNGYLAKCINAFKFFKFLKIRVPNDLTFKDIIVPTSFDDVSHFKRSKFNNLNGRILDFVLRMISKIRGKNSRLEMYRLFFAKNDFSSVFNDKIWWKDGVFK